MCSMIYTQCFSNKNSPWIFSYSSTYPVYLYEVVLYGKDTQKPSFHFKILALFYMPRGLTDRTLR